jgi:hypothetical protein
MAMMAMTTNSSIRVKARPDHHHDRKRKRGIGETPRAIMMEIRKKHKATGRHLERLLLIESSWKLSSTDLIYLQMPFSKTTCGMPKFALPTPSTPPGQWRQGLFPIFIFCHSATVSRHRWLQPNDG